LVLNNRMHLVGFLVLLHILEYEYVLAED
jgi:hypothetical protein